MKDKTGEIRENTNGTKMKIIKYIRSDNIFVEFQDECKYIVNCQYKEFKLGKIKNPYDKKVFGVGYLGVGNYLPYKDKGKTTVYRDWETDRKSVV